MLDACRQLGCLSNGSWIHVALLADLHARLDVEVLIKTAGINLVDKLQLNQIADAGSQRRTRYRIGEVGIRLLGRGRRRQAFTL